MTTKSGIREGCDALDIAALWPASAQLAGIPIPDLESNNTAANERSRSRDR
jgi:hypothetical protein